jgi:type II secretory pathway pseudopilin PulG
MSVGQRDKGSAVFDYPRALLVSKKSFTIIEILITTFVLTVIMAGLFLVLDMAEFSQSATSAKLELRAELRRAMDWIIKDVRQTSAYQIANNAPTSSHIKFKVCLGHNGTSLIWSDNYIEYTYDSTLKRITRTESASGRSWYFNYIITEPFDVSGVSTNSKLIVTISGERQRQGLPDITSTLTAQVKLRNA